MSPTLEPRICPDCAATFYLTSKEALELPPHGCPGPAGRPSPAADQAAGQPTLEAKPAPADSGPTPAPDLFSSLQDQERAPGQPSQASPPGELREETARFLRERGYVLSQDAHGLRISGDPVGRPDRSALSPSDIVRMAAELDGGVKQASTLQTCPKCQARTPAGEPKCQWCGEPFPRAESSG
jgi:hypothetical protein